MIRRLHITGFQSLADVELPLGRFTVIQGRSNSGKSAVIRALRAVVTNAGNLRGTSGSFIHQGSKGCSVTIERDTGTLTWAKTKTKTTYTLNDRDPFVTGQEVPPDVVEFLKLGDIALDADNKVNVNFQGGAANQGQFEPPFLVVDRTGSYLAKVLSLLTSANVLYAAQAVAKKDSRAHNGKMKTMREVHEGELARLAALQEDYRPLHAAAERARTLQTTYESTINEHGRLVAARDHIASLDHQLAECTASLAALAAVDVTAAAASLDSLVEQRSSYVAWRDTVAATDAELQAVTAQLDATLPAGADEQLAELQSLADQRTNLQTWATTLATTDADLVQLDTALVAAEAELQTAHEEFVALVDEIDLCPTCNHKLEAQVMLV